MPTWSDATAKHAQAHVNMMWEGRGPPGQAPAGMRDRRCPLKPGERSRALNAPPSSLQLSNHENRPRRRCVRQLGSAPPPPVAEAATPTFAAPMRRICVP